MISLGFNGGSPGRDMTIAPFNIQGGAGIETQAFIMGIGDSLSGFLAISSYASP
jgi:hypothetical protein